MKTKNLENYLNLFANNVVKDSEKLLSSAKGSTALGNSIRAKVSEDVNGFRDSLNEYCLQIPEAENILKRMEELDAQVEEDIKNKEKKEKEDQNKQEKDSGAKE